MPGFTGITQGGRVHYINDPMANDPMTRCPDAPMADDPMP